MKNILIFLFICFGFALNSQITITCYECKKNTTVDCKGCNIQSNLFTGIVIKEKGKPDIPLYEPYKVSNKSSVFTFEDAFGTKTIVNVTSVLNYNTPKKLYDYLSNCLCKPSTIDTDTDRYSVLIQDSILVTYDINGVEIDRDTIRLFDIDTDTKTFLVQDSILVYYDIQNNEIGRDTIKIPFVDTDIQTYLTQDSILVYYDESNTEIGRDTIRLASSGIVGAAWDASAPQPADGDLLGTDAGYLLLPMPVDKFHSNIVGTAPYDPLLPLTGWVAPTNPIEGNTVEVKFTDGTVGNYTFDGTVWGLDFVNSHKHLGCELILNGTSDNFNVSYIGLDVVTEVEYSFTNTSTNDILIFKGPTLGNILTNVYDGAQIYNTSSAIDLSKILSKYDLHLSPLPLGNMTVNSGFIKGENNENYGDLHVKVRLKYPYGWSDYSDIKTIKNTGAVVSDINFVELASLKRNAKDVLYYNRVSDDYLTVIVPQQDDEAIRYGFDKGLVLQDDYMRIKSIERITYSKTNKIYNRKNYNEVSGTYITASPPNHYASTIGSTFSVDFYGDAILFRHPADNRGAIWRLYLNDDSNNYIDVDTYNPSFITKTQLLWDNLPFGKHTITGELIGVNPLNTSGQTRGWLSFGSGTDSTFDIYKDHTITPLTAVNVTAPGSNIEIAFSAKEDGASYAGQFLPHHNSGQNATATYFKIFIDNIDKTTNYHSEYLSCNTVHIIGEYEVVNTNDPLLDVLFSMKTQHIIDTKGVFYDVNLSYLKNTMFEIAYNNMLPCNTDWFDYFIDSKGNKYPKLTNLLQTKLNTISKGYLFYSETDNVYLDNDFSNTFHQNYREDLTSNWYDNITPQKQNAWYRLDNTKIYNTPYYQNTRLIGETDYFSGQIVAFINNNFGPIFNTQTYR